ncbi:MAG: dephospho-CoA kinase [Clostridiales bacterium]|nr:dephospho-CoA kinase [Clostridiales bacterium]
MSKNIIVGLTGQTGAGKSMVAHRCLAKNYGIVDGDVVCHEIYDNNRELTEELKNAFGDDILNSDGTINRKQLGKKAFSSKENIDMLNKITHPTIIAEISRQVKEIFKSGKNIAVVDAAALIESGFDKECDILAVVYAPSEIRLQRIMMRDGLDEKTARMRISAQKKAEFYKEKADIIINNCPPFDLEKEMMNFYKRVENTANN